MSVNFETGGGVVWKGDQKDPESKVDSSKKSSTDLSIPIPKLSVREQTLHKINQKLTVLEARPKEIASEIEILSNNLLKPSENEQKTTHLKQELKQISDKVGQLLTIKIAHLKVDLQSYDQLSDVAKESLFHNIHQLSDGGAKSELLKMLFETGVFEKMPEDQQRQLMNDVMKMKGEALDAVISKIVSHPEFLALSIRAELDAPSKEENKQSYFGDFFRAKQAGSLAISLLYKTGISEQSEFKAFVAEQKKKGDQSGISKESAPKNAKEVIQAFCSDYTVTNSDQSLHKILYQEVKEKLTQVKAENPEFLAKNLVVNIFCTRVFTPMFISQGTAANKEQAKAILKLVAENGDAESIHAMADKLIGPLSEDEEKQLAP